LAYFLNYSTDNKIVGALVTADNFEVVDNTSACYCTYVTLTAADAIGQSLVGHVYVLWQNGWTD